MRNGEEAVTTLSELAALGISIAIDDFGTGLFKPQLSEALSGGPVEDRSLVRGGYRRVGRGNETITSAIIALAHSLDLQVIAEGVETTAQLEFLVARECDEMQGFLFSRPVPAGEIPALLLNSRTAGGRYPRRSSPSVQRRAMRAADGRYRSQHRSASLPSPSPRLPSGSCAAHRPRPIPSPTYSPSSRYPYKSSANRRQTPAA